MEENESEFKLPKKEFQDVMNEMIKAGSETKDSAELKDENNKKSTTLNSNSGSETPKSGTKRPTRSTPGSGMSSAKRRK